MMKYIIIFGSIIALIFGAMWSLEHKPDSAKTELSANADKAIGKSSSGDNKIIIPAPKEQPKYVPRPPVPEYVPAPAPEKPKAEGKRHYESKPDFQPSDLSVRPLERQLRNWDQPTFVPAPLPEPTPQPEQPPTDPSVEYKVGSGFFHRMWHHTENAWNYTMGGFKFSPHHHHVKEDQWHAHTY